MMGLYSGYVLGCVPVTLRPVDIWRVRYIAHVITHSENFGILQSMPKFVGAGVIMLVAGKYPRKQERKFWKRYDKAYRGLING